MQGISTKQSAVENVPSVSETIISPQHLCRTSGNCALHCQLTTLDKSDFLMTC